MEYLSKKAETAFSIQKEELQWNKKTVDEKAKRDSLYFQQQYNDEAVEQATGPTASTNTSVNAANAAVNCPNDAAATATNASNDEIFGKVSRKRLIIVFLFKSISDDCFHFAVWVFFPEKEINYIMT